jgi:hypothetical protein
MHDTEATFYGGYDQAGLRLPSLHLNWLQFALAVGVVAVIVLLWTVV